MRADGVQKYQPGRPCAPSRTACGERACPAPKRGTKSGPRAAAGALRISGRARPAHRARRTCGGAPPPEAPQAACHTGACLPDAGHRAAGRAAPDVRCPARRDGGRRRRAERRSAHGRGAHEGPPYTIAIDAGHGGTDIGAEGVINEIQLTEATIGYLEGWLTQDENYTSVRTHAADTFSKNTERAAAANSAGASLLLSVHGNSDPYSSDSYGLECYPQPPGRTHHEDSLRLAHLIADKFGAAGQRLRGNAGVRYIYYAGDDESGYEKQVVEESDSTVYSEQTFGLLEKTDCPAVLVEQCFVTSEADVAAWGTDDGCRRAARLYYEAICEYFGTEPLPGT
ncbi:MAG: N-acetylmuramoyl-L-alanine amidase [Ruthenibacterium lactatiformans]|uniref:N-acetylmuramoyl-L-alanine amidase n=1 Tax=Ruthenibacterium lactatiformans TaxID=1550024 RepID=UPI003994D5B2